MELETIGHISELARLGVTDYRQYGEVDTKINGDLILFNYSGHAMVTGRWNFFERVSRGLIMSRVTGEVVARPFDKFFNWGENGRTDDTELLDAMEKIDGSLGILYRHANQFQIATRGSFDSPQARWATAYLNAHHDLRSLDPELTLLFEIVYPENRVVIDYGRVEGLFLLGVRNRFTGYDYPWHDVYDLAERYGFPTPVNYAFTGLDDILQAAHTIPASQEGWVLRFASGNRFKVKGDLYKIAHRLMTGISFSRVLDAVASGAYDAMVSGIPDEFLGVVKTYRDEIVQTRERIEIGVHQHMRRAPTRDRKAFAQYVFANCPDLQAYMFAALDGREWKHLIYKQAFKNRKEEDLEAV